MGFEWSATIEGIRPISKKNSPRIFGSGKHKVRLPSLAYERFRGLFLEAVKDLIPPEAYDTDFILYFDLYTKGKLDIDFDNAETSVLDVMTDAGIITDDKLMTGHHGNKIRGEKDWRLVIRLKERVE